ncbi:hypothetical protein AGJ35_01705 [Cronobacter dublinensis subsp. dublinensis]|nr:hypothetical protein [Cronobacter dublinensis subsp. dublinensis]EGT5737749.1 hypothetical protein [Cronobacter dublinensis subsp. dublinensis]
MSALSEKRTFLTSACTNPWRTDLAKNSAGEVTRLPGDPLQVATWLQACHDAGIHIQMQMNESDTPDECTLPHRRTGQTLGSAS